MRRITTSLTTAAAAALLLAVSACSSSGGSADRSTGAASAPPPTTGAPTTPVGSTPAASASAVSENQVKAALLKASELGTGFTEAAFAESPYPLPCARTGSPPFNTRAPAVTAAARRLDADALGASFTEQIRVYADPSGARSAYDIGMKGLHCTTGTLYATGGSKVPVQIGKPQDLAAPLGIDSATAWSLQSSQVQVIYVAAVLGKALVLLGFTNSPKADTAKLPDPEQVTKAAIDKIKSA